MDEDPRHVVVAMSGGVDSAVAAHLLREQGFRVTGLFMSNGVHADADDAPARKGCCSDRDAADAERCARRLGIEFFRLDFKRAFEHIVEHFQAEYERGRTPNPCIDCNQQLKFGKLIAYARGIGAASVATGHYARIGTAGVRRYVARAADHAKDQSYVLMGLSQPQLARARFPIGELTKPEVRSIARDAGLCVSEKPESQDICFVPGGDYREVLRRRGAAFEPGEVADADGRVLGHHDGTVGFTIGQRRGLGVATGEPRYVIRIEPKDARVVVGSRADLLRAELTASRATWMRCPGLASGESLAAWARIRSHHVPARATVTGTDDPSRVHVRFHEPQSAVTPGQALCLYGEDGAVEGGAWID